MLTAVLHLKLGSLAYLFHPPFILSANQQCQNTEGLVNVSLYRDCTMYVQCTSAFRLHWLQPELSSRTQFWQATVCVDVSMLRYVLSMLHYVLSLLRCVLSMLLAWCGCQTEWGEEADWRHVTVVQWSSHQGPVCIHWHSLSVDCLSVHSAQWLAACHVTTATHQGRLRSRSLAAPQDDACVWCRQVRLHFFHMCSVCFW